MNVSVPDGSSVFHPENPADQEGGERGAFPYTSPPRLSRGLGNSIVCGFTAQRTIVMKAAERSHGWGGQRRQLGRESLKGWDNMHGWSWEDKPESRTLEQRHQSRKGWELPEVQGRLRVSGGSVELVGVAEYAVCGRTLGWGGCGHGATVTSGILVLLLHCLADSLPVPETDIDMADPD